MTAFAMRALGKDARLPAGSIKVLLVEDGAMMRRLIRTMLKVLGVTTVVEAHDGAEALALLRHEPFDLVVSDWHMAPMDGLDLLRHIRRDRALGNVPFLMMTAEQSALCIEEVVLADASFLPKPFRVEELSGALSRFVSGLAVI